MIFKDFSQNKEALHQEMLSQLHHLCAINSGSENLDGLARMHQELHNLFSPIADHIETMDGGPMNIVTMQGESCIQPCGRHLLIRKRPEMKRRILLTGHMDTVFAKEHPFQGLQLLEDNVLNGPGVADMKGGLLIMAHALKQFETTAEADSIGWDVFINSDEEIGSYSSAPIMDAIAPNYQAGLIYEPSTLPDGTLARNRKGSGKLTLVAKGKAAHAGRAFYEGRNAIAFLAPIISDVHQLNGQRENVTINLGKISGGEALNIVAETAVVKLDIRINDPEDEFWVRERLQQIAQKYQQEGYHLDIHGTFARPVKKITRATERLFERIQTVARSMGIAINWQDSGGCCDGNNIAAHGVPVIDTLGVRGGKIHSSEEYVLLDSLTERTLLSSLLLHDLAKGGLEELAL